MKKIRIGQIGTAHDHAEAKLRTALSHPEVFEVLGVVYSEGINNDNPFAYNFVDIPRLTMDELFDLKPDAIIVEAFELDLVRVATECVKRGIHVHMDKPAGLDIKDYENMLKIAEKNKLIVQLGYMYRYNPALKYLYQKVDEGSIGDIIQIDCEMNALHPLAKRKWLKHFDAGIMFFLGCHLVDIIYRLQGPPKSIQTFNQKTRLDETDVVDNSLVVLNYGYGVSTLRVNSNQVNGFGQRRILVTGTKGTIEIKPIEGPTRLFISKVENNTTSTKEISMPSFGRYDNQLLEFADYIRGIKENPFTYQYELELQALFLACCDENIDWKKYMLE